MKKIGILLSLILSISFFVSCGGGNTNSSNENGESDSFDSTYVSETLAQDIVGIWSFGRKGAWIEIKGGGIFNIGKGNQTLEKDKKYELSNTGEFVINTEKGVKKFRAKIEDGILKLRQEGKTKDMKCKPLKEIPK